MRTCIFTLHSVSEELDFNADMYSHLTQSERRGLDYTMRICILTLYTVSRVGLDFNADMYFHLYIQYISKVGWISMRTRILTFTQSKRDGVGFILPFTQSKRGRIGFQCGHVFSPYTE